MLSQLVRLVFVCAALHWSSTTATALDARARAVALPRCPRRNDDLAHCANGELPFVCQLCCLVVVFAICCTLIVPCGFARVECFGGRVPQESVRLGACKCVVPTNAVAFAAQQMSDFFVSFARVTPLRDCDAAARERQCKRLAFELSRARGR